MPRSLMGSALHVREGHVSRKSPRKPPLSERIRALIAEVPPTEFGSAADRKAAWVRSDLESAMNRAKDLEYMLNPPKP